MSLQNEFNCTISAFVTDGASNMDLCRQTLMEVFPHIHYHRYAVITWPSLAMVACSCQAHLLNLVAKDILDETKRKEVFTQATAVL